MTPSTPEDIERVEAHIAALRMEQASIDTRRRALLTELSELVARLPKEEVSKWYAKGSYQVLLTK